jgi:hypothetical protein
VKQVLLRFSLPSGRTFHTQDFKEAVARTCNRSTVVPPKFFHYQNGQPIPDQEPDIRFVGGSRWVGILSRSGDANAVLPVAGLAAQLVSQRMGCPVPMQIEEPEYGIEITDYPVTYYFRDVASKRANRRRGSSEDLLIRLLCDCLRRERDRVGFDLPKKNASEDADREAVRERLGIVVHDMRELGMRLTTASGATKQFVHLMSGSLSMCAKTTGIWQFGSLQSRGHGRLIPQRGARQ